MASLTRQRASGGTPTGLLPLDDARQPGCSCLFGLMLGQPRRFPTADCPLHRIRP